MGTVKFESRIRELVADYPDLAALDLSDPRGRTPNVALNPFCRGVCLLRAKPLTLGKGGHAFPQVYEALPFIVADERFLARKLPHRLHRPQSSSASRLLGSIHHAVVLLERFLGTRDASIRLN